MTTITDVAAALTDVQTRLAAQQALADLQGFEAELNALKSRTKAGDTEVAYRDLILLLTKALRSTAQLAQTATDKSRRAVAAAERLEGELKAAKQGDTLTITIKDLEQSPKPAAKYLADLLRPRKGVQP